MRELMYQLERMYALLEMRSDQEGKIMKDLLEEISDHHGFDMGCFLVDLPFDLERDGFEDEAISVARKFAFVDEANMRGDLGQILASSGRCEEALAQVRQNLRDLSDDAWVVIKAGDVYDECGQPEKAVDLYNRVVEMTEDQYTKDGAYERLISLYEKMGKNEEARALQGRWGKEYGESMEEREPYRPLSRTSSSPKIGRNEPCPCGSGLKYKKCCLNK